jgi:hypothetical protein
VAILNVQFHHESGAVRNARQNLFRIAGRDVNAGPARRETNGQCCWHVVLSEVQGPRTQDWRNGSYS